jgi:Uma2 family endonuclease
MAVESAQQVAREPYERWRFTVDDFMLMGKAGIFKEGDRVELIDGEVVRMNPIGPGHSGRVMRLTGIFAPLVPHRAILSVQNPFQFRPRQQPQPDVTLLRPREDFYTTSHPTAADTLLLIEVADSSLDYDRDTKVRIYAQAGVQEYWIIDLVNIQLLVYRQPVSGRYRSIQTFTREAIIQPLEFPDITINVAEILA